MNSNAFNTIFSRIFLKGSSLRVLFHGTPTINVLLHSKERIFGNLGVGGFHGTQCISKKSAKILIDFRNFFQKINVLSFRIALNSTTLKNLHEISFKLHSGHFLTILKVFKIFETWPRNSVFIAFSRNSFSWMCCFRGQKSDFVLFRPP